MRFVVAMLVALSLFAPAPASADVTPNQSIGPFELGMSRAQVRRVAGTPLRVKKWKNGNWRWTFKNGYRVTGKKWVLGIEYTGMRERGPGGIGVGSTQDEALAAGWECGYGSCSYCPGDWQCLITARLVFTSIFFDNIDGAGTAFMVTVAMVDPQKQKRPRF